MRLLTGHRSPVHDVAFSPTEPKLLSIAGQGKRVSLWNVLTGKRMFLPGADHPIAACRFSPDGRRVAGLTVTHELLLWEPDGGELVGSTPPSPFAFPYYLQSTGVPDLEFDAGGNWIYLTNVMAEGTLFGLTEFAMGRAMPPTDPCVRRFSIDGLNEAPLFENARRSVFDLTSPEPDSLLLLTEHVAGPGEEIEPEYVETPFGFRFFVSTADPSRRSGHVTDVVRYRFGDGEHAPRRSSIHCYASFLAGELGDGRFVVAEDDRLLIANGTSGAIEHRVTAHRPGISSMTMTPDGQGLLTGSLDESIKLWNVQTLELINEWRWGAGGVYSLAAAPDGTRFAAGTEKGVLIWDAEPTF